jgi:hypothetical protein
MQRRLKEFGLTVHPKKTRLTEFGRFAAENRASRGKGKPETFNFLGFTHIRKDRSGRFMLIRKTRRDQDDGNTESDQRRSTKALALLNPRTGKMAQESGSGIPELPLSPGHYPMMRKFRIYVTDLWRPGAEAQEPAG